MSPTSGPERSPRDFATTILGVLAIGDIRRSRPRLIGMPLALADALFYPLLVLDALLLLFLAVATALAAHFFAPLLGFASLPTVVFLGLALLVAAPICILLDFLLIRAAWRRVTGGYDRPGKQGAA